MVLEFKKVLGSILSEVTAYSFFFPSLSRSGHFMVPIMTSLQSHTSTDYTDVGERAFGDKRK